MYVHGSGKGVYLGVALPVRSRLDIVKGEVGNGLAVARVSIPLRGRERGREGEREREGGRGREGGGREEGGERGREGEEGRERREGGRGGRFLVPSPVECPHVPSDRK